MHQQRQHGLGLAAVTQEADSDGKHIGRDQQLFLLAGIGMDEVDLPGRDGGPEPERHSFDAVASARGVLDDVELALRQVAELPACVKRRDVELVQKDVEARQLLMRIRLMTRELEG